MLLTIPYQAFEVENVHLLPFQCNYNGKCMARLIYKDHSIDFHDICILSPPIKVVDYNAKTSKLRVDLSEYPQFQSKLNMLYDYIINTFYHQQHIFLPHSNSQSMATIQQMFYSLIDGHIMTLYAHPNTFINKDKEKKLMISEVQPGDKIRYVFRIQGVSQLLKKDRCHFRLQHSIPSIWFL
jgi:hypothetical protein